MEHCRVRFRGQDKVISIHRGATLLEAAGQAGIILNAVCGGEGTCRKCEVILRPEGRRVLACLYRVEVDVEVEVPAGSIYFQEKILRHGVDRKVKVAPSIHEHIGGLKDKANVFGAAVDIGTTTVVVKLINMADGRCAATAAAANPQIACGDDVVSRIVFAEREGGLERLNELIVSCVNDLIGEACSEAGVERDDVYELTVAGNTTMCHILLKYPLAQLGQAPYRAYSTAAQDRRAASMGIAINGRGNVHVIESIAGFVGSDTTAVAVAADIEQIETTTLVVDIGTNGEILLATKDGILAASCAAGPAFEGARISQGARASEGAIEAVIVEGDDIDVDVIGGGAGRTICGSGLIDAMAVLVELGIVSSSGLMRGRYELDGRLPKAIVDRVIERGGQGAFVLWAGGKQVVLTQRDIRETQLAKAAVRAGIRLLQRKAGIGDEDIGQILLAGAFGNYINRNSALKVGLLPAVGVEKVHFIGNAASSGAQMVLVSSECRELAGRLAAKIEYVEIAHQADFQEVFAEELMFDNAKQ
jgi:uncharacterized 2Fe-2S/4Fe-4S cluster protein (DUF4445 family)